MIGTIEKLIKRYGRDMAKIKSELKKKGMSIGNKCLAIRIKKLRK